VPVTGAAPTAGAPWAKATATNYPSKKIRWYGYPRNISGATTVKVVGGANYVIDFTPGPRYEGGSPNAMNFNELCDVVPLRDAWILFYLNNPSLTETYNPYEVEEPLGAGLPGGTTATAMINYGDPTQFAPLTSYAYLKTLPVTESAYSYLQAVPYPSSTGKYGKYVALWRDDVPAMVRILVKVDDPNSGQSNGPWFEYVFKLK